MSGDDLSVDHCLTVYKALPACDSGAGLHFSCARGSSGLHRHSRCSFSSPAVSLIRSPHALFHSGNQFSVIAGLKQVVQCPDGNRSFRVRKLVKRSQENNAACRAHRADLLGGFKARDARHLDIQNQDICRFLLIKRDDFSSVSGLTQTDAVTEILF